MKKRFFLSIISIFVLSTFSHAFAPRYESLNPQPIEEFTFKNASGEPITLEKYKGKVIVLNFWSLTCGPCIAEMPSLDKLAGTYTDKDLMVISLNVDPVKKEGLEAFYDENHYQYLEIFQDQVRASHEIFKWQALPTTLIINREGKLMGRLTGSAQWDSPEALHMFDQIIQGKIPQFNHSFFDKFISWFR